LATVDRIEQQIPRDARDDTGVQIPRDARDDTDVQIPRVVGMTAS